MQAGNFANVFLTCARTICMQIRRRVLTEEAHLSRGKNTYTLYIYAETFECARKFRSAAWRSWQTTSLAKQDFAAARVRVGVCVAEENV